MSFLSLTAQEANIAAAVAQGGSTREVADLPVLCPCTVETHLSSVDRKLGVTGRAGSRIGHPHVAPDRTESQWRASAVGVCAGADGDQLADLACCCSGWALTQDCFDDEADPVAGARPEVERVLYARSLLAQERNLQ